ncbi:MAG TPA: hypothetical protein PLQ22_00580 [Bacilli bacterium]|nr:hypothetical protein [Bacilli bacterium]
MKMSHHFPLDKLKVEEDVNAIPSITDEDHKYYLSLYQDEQLVAVIDFIDGFSFKKQNNENTIWIGLLQINKTN